MKEHDRIERSVDLDAPVSRVWRALTDHREFGEWFEVKLEKPFAVNQVSRGHITHPGYEHIPWESVVKCIEPEKKFAYSWHPFAIDPKVDYSGEKPTLVEFTLGKSKKGTRLTVLETGFDQLPSARRQKAFEMHEHGWTEQMKNIEKYLRQE
ncbi:MAG: SRPBCC family protein [Verrucomicrobiae bacterium]|nr:SRPBCC family protein [Verrucomicrobiae bacterium]